MTGGVEMAKSCAFLLSVALLAAPAGRAVMKRICIGLAMMVSLAWLGPGLRAEEPWQDWNRVQALQPGQKIVVKAFKGRGPKVVGTYVSSDAGHLVVRRRNGQAVTISKDHIRQVVRKRRVRHAVKIGAAAGFAIMASLTLSVPIGDG